jgi:hypothetical protein
VIAALALFACGTDTPEPQQTPDPGTDLPVPNAELPELDPTALARRISLDVRGEPPTLEEYRAVLDDPAALDGLVDTWLADPRFADRIVELYAEIYLSRTESFPFSAHDLNAGDPVAFDRALGEEPLRILARIAAEDLPYTDLVTADWTMANDTLAAAFPIDLPGSGEAWRVGHYTDGRPAAGVLSTTGLMWRYTSTTSNANRKRANQVSRVLLCNDYLTRPVDFDRNVNLLDEGAVLDALKNDPTCVSCHVSLDPLASYFYGFWWLREDSAIDAALYHPERERFWQDITGVAPGYYGQPGNTLRDLGVQIASDPRFVECAVEQAWELLLRRDSTLEDFEALTRHREAFLQGGLTVRALMRSILTDPAYRAANTDDPAAASLKLATPDLLASQVEALTGYRWTWAGYDMFTSDEVGIRTLSGGADGFAVTSTARSPNATSVLAQQRLAEASVVHARNTDPSRLFGTADLAQPPTDQALADLMLVVLGQVVEPDGEEVAALSELWDQLFAVESDATGAWAGVAYALMRDPAFVLY